MKAASIPRWKRGCTIETHQSQYRRFSNITRLTGQLHPPQMMMDTDTCCNKVIIKGCFSYLNENTYFVKIFWQPLPPLYPGGLKPGLIHIHNTVQCISITHTQPHTVYCTLLAVRAMLAVGLLTPGTAGWLLATHAASSYPPS